MEAKNVLKRISNLDKVLAGLVTVVTGAATMMSGIKAVAEAFLVNEDTKAIEDANDE